MPHSHSASTTSRGRLLTTLLLNWSITVAELVGGLWSGSLSLLSDALHNFSDGVAIIIAYLALRLRDRAKSERFTFGLKRAEILAAVFNAATLIAICFYLFWESYRRLIAPEPVAGGLMVAVAGIGLVANVIGTLLLKRGARENMNLRSAYLHLFSDAVSSIAVMLGGMAIYFLDIYWLDPLLTILISLYVLKESFHIVGEATDMLLMASPEGLSLSEIQRAVEAIPGVNNLHHAHLWQLNEHDVHFEAHLEVREDMSIRQAQALGKQVETLLESSFGINHATLQFECDACASKTLLKSEATS